MANWTREKYRAHKQVREPTTGLQVACDLWWTQLRHAQTHERLFLVKARVKQGVMYLITNEPVDTEAQAWEVFFQLPSKMANRNSLIANSI